VSIACLWKCQAPAPPSLQGDHCLEDDRASGATGSLNCSRQTGSLVIIPSLLSEYFTKAIKARIGFTASPASGFHALHTGRHVFAPVCFAASWTAKPIVPNIASIDWLHARNNEFAKFWGNQAVILFFMAKHPQLSHCGPYTRQEKFRIFF